MASTKYSSRRKGKTENTLFQHVCQTNFPARELSMAVKNVSISWKVSVLTYSAKQILIKLEDGYAFIHGRVSSTTT